MLFNDVKLKAGIIKRLYRKSKGGIKKEKKGKLRKEKKVDIKGEIND